VVCQTAIGAPNNKPTKTFKVSAFPNACKTACLIVLNRINDEKWRLKIQPIGVYVSSLEEENGDEHYGATEELGGCGSISSKLP